MWASSARPQNYILGRDARLGGHDEGPVPVLGECLHFEAAPAKKKVEVRLVLPKHFCHRESLALISQIQSHIFIM